MRDIWIEAIAPILTEVIDKQLAAMREKLFHDELSMALLDNEGGRARRSGFWTNLGINATALMQDEILAPKMIKIIQEKILTTIDENISVLDPSLLWPDEKSLHLRDASRNIIERLGLPSVSEPSTPDQALAIISAEHNPLLVDYWRKYEAQIKFIFVLLGTPYKHIQANLNLPDGHYLPLMSEDILLKVPADKRKKIIPEYEE